MPLPLYKAKSNTIKNILAVASGKGGVGKSLVSVSLARAFFKMGYKVGLLDADLYGPSVKKMVTEEKVGKEEEGILIPSIAEGIKYLSMASFKTDQESSTLRAPLANQLIKLFLNAQWGELDYLIIDFPPGTGDIQIELAQSANISSVLLVTTPQEIALIDVRRSASLFNKVNIPVCGIVENMSYYKDKNSADKKFLFGQGGGKKLSQEYQVPLLAEIPLVPELGRLSDLGFSFFESESGELKEVRDLFLKIAKDLEFVQTPIDLKAMAPFGPAHFTIEWMDGLKQKFELSELQKRCPCSLCLGNGTFEKDSFAKGVFKVGRYAIKIDFVKGCKNGLYSYHYLRQLGKAL